MNRRSFLSTSAAAGTTLLSTQFNFAAIGRLENKIKIGLIADLHQDIMHDAPSRLKAFVDQVEKVQPDAIMQLGDFAVPSADNKHVIEMFNHAHDRSLHVIGNHDTDGGHTKQQVLDTFGMSSPYYVENVNGLSMIVLDGNDKGSPTYKGGYPSYIGREQTKWLKTQLDKLDDPIVVVSHQPLAGPAAVDNAEEIQTIIGEAAGKVILALCGHTHVDYLVRAKRVPYLHINSASYKWVGGNYKHASYNAKIHEEHPSIAYTCPYKDSLFAFLEFDPQSQTVKLIGRKSQWVGQSPEQLGEDPGAALIPGENIAPQISDRTITRIKKR